MKRSIPNNKPSRMEREKVLALREARRAKNLAYRLAEKSKAEVSISEFEDIDSDFTEQQDGTH